MNFKKLIQRYREGTATAEEKKLVEQELEKYESIEEYLTEELDERFIPGEASEKGEDPHHTRRGPGEDFNIRQLVNRRLRRVILTSVVIVVLLYVTIFYGISALVDQIHYDPSAVTKAEEGEYPGTDFHFDITAYVSLNMPGYALASFTPTDSQGFGNYEIRYPLRDLFTRERQGHRVDISRSRLAYADGGIFDIQHRHNLWEGFDLIRYPGHFESEDMGREEAEEHLQRETRRKNEITKEYLDEMNPLSYLSMHMVFEEDLSMLEFLHLSREHRDLEFKWVGIRTNAEGTRWSENQPQHLIGFNPNPGDEPSGNSRPDPEEYPLFYLGDLWDENLRHDDDFAEMYETHFHSRLRYLSGRQEFIEIFDYNIYKEDFYQQALEYVEDQGIYTYGVVVHGTAGDFREAMEDLPYESLFIHEALPVSPNIYY